MNYAKNLIKRFSGKDITNEAPKKAPLALDKNSKFVYKMGADVQAIWRNHGWTPPTEYRDDYLFKKNREETHG